jgi:hypothetical protein
MADIVVTCVYCGMQYPEDTPCHGAEILTEHIKVCEKHPLRKAECEIVNLENIIMEQNEMLSSAFYIAERNGNYTDWDTFKQDLIAVLTTHSTILKTPKKYMI